MPTGKTKGSKDVSQTIAQIFVDEKQPERVWFGMYASGLNEPAGVWRSADGGASWVASSAGIDTGDQLMGPMTMRRDWVMRFAHSVAEPDVFFVATLCAVYRSGDGART